MDSLNRINYAWIDLVKNKSDPRVRDWFLMESPTPTFLLIAAYIYFVKVLGPRWMENRKPFKLTNVIIAYNILQVCLSTYLFYESFMGAWVFGGYSWKCEPVDYSRSPQAMRIASACWLYFMSKFTEFLDTVFFVLRKKNEHVSVLHVVHHTIMPFGCYFGVLFIPGGSATFFGFLNTFVHIIMYSYYLLAALGPKYQKYLWWKKYITVLQLAQFSAVLIHSVQLVFRSCSFPKWYTLIFIFYSILFLVMFSNFYVKAYRSDKKVKTVKSNEKTHQSSKEIESKMD